ncbi:MAG: DUF2179 domain-containing protein [Mycoplasma sp.]
MAKTAKKRVIDFKRGATQEVQFSSQIIRLSRFYNITNYKHKLLLVIGLGCILSVATLFLVENPGLYSGGIGSFFQGVARMLSLLVRGVQHDPNYEHAFLDTFIYNCFFWGMYLLFNLSLLGFLSLTMNKKFLGLSLAFILSAQLFGFCLALIPGIENITIFGDGSSVNKVQAVNKIACIIFDPNAWPTPRGGVEAINYDWSTIEYNESKVIILVKNDIETENIVRAFVLFLYISVHSLIAAFTNSLAFILGSSTGGTETFSIYLSEIKNKNLGAVLKLNQLVFMTLGVLLGSYFTNFIVFPDHIGTYSSWQYAISANYLAAILWILFNSFVINVLYPSKKLVRIEIFTNKIEEVLKSLKDTDYTHPTTVINSFGGYSRKNNNILVTVCPLVHVSCLVEAVREVDEKSLISTLNIDDCDGRVGILKHNSKVKTA